MNEKEAKEYLLKACEAAGGRFIAVPRDVLIVACGGTVAKSAPKKKENEGDGKPKQPGGAAD